MIYLDHAATTPMLDCVKQKMHEMIDLGLGNASALHSPGQYANRLIQEARENVARLINADPSEIIFTSGGSESNNTVMHTFAGQDIAISAIEHPSAIEAAKVYAKHVEYIPVDQWGRISIQHLPSNVQLVSVMMANNELGTLEPIQEIAQYYRQNAASHTYIHTDATQALGKIHIDVKALDVDYLTCSAHKIGGPLGIGLLYIKKGSPITPLIYGGHQEYRLRAGTSNVLGIVGFGEAAKWCWEHWSCKKCQEVKQLRDLLRQRILSEVPYSSANSPEGGCLPNILNMSFQAAEGESIQLYLDAAGVAVSTGSACAAGDLEPSYVIIATKKDAEVAHSSIRFSLGLDATSEDINQVMQVLPDIIGRLQGISTIKVGD